MDEVIKGVLTTCTGGMVAAMVGVLDWKTAATNHQYLATAKELKPDVNWSSKQWVVDGMFWTAGGALAGMDMFAHWVTENYGQDIAETGYLSLDFEPRDVNEKPVSARFGPPQSFSVTPARFFQTNLRVRSPSLRTLKRLTSLHSACHQ